MAKCETEFNFSTEIAVDLYLSYLHKIILYNDVIEWQFLHTKYVHIHNKLTPLMEGRYLQYL
jgi:hypothetical protein